MSPHQQRMLEELAQLTERHDKLNAFIQGPMFERLPDEEREDMWDQWCAMRLYLRALLRRVSRFN